MVSQVVMGTLKPSNDPRTICSRAFVQSGVGLTADVVRKTKVLGGGGRFAAWITDRERFRKVLGFSSVWLIHSLIENMPVRDRERKFTVNGDVPLNERQEDKIMGK